MSNEAVPILFTVDGSSRHEILLISPTHATLPGVHAQIIQLAGSSPNCEQYMSKYAESHAEPIVQELKVRWSPSVHDAKLWPASTIVTEENFEAIVKMMGQAAAVGRDLWEVKIGEGKEK